MQFQWEPAFAPSHFKSPPQGLSAARAASAASPQKHGPTSKSAGALRSQKIGANHLNLRAFTHTRHHSCRIPTSATYSAPPNRSIPTGTSLPVPQGQARTAFGYLQTAIMGRCTLPAEYLRDGSQPATAPGTHWRTTMASRARRGPKANTSLQLPRRSRRRWRWATSWLTNVRTPHSC